MSSLWVRDNHPSDVGPAAAKTEKVFMVNTTANWQVPYSCNFYGESHSAAVSSHGDANLQEQTKTAAGENADSR